MKMKRAKIPDMCKTINSRSATVHPDFVVLNADGILPLVQSAYWKFFINGFFPFLQLPAEDRLPSPKSQYGWAISVFLYISFCSVLDCANFASRIFR